jgi:NarL family two-component system response regulator LiaR
VVIADDHRVVRRGLRALLRLDPALRVVGEARDERQALQLIRRLRPDVVLADLLDDLNDLLDRAIASEAIRSELGESRAIALTGVLDDDKVAAAVRAAAIDYRLEPTEAHELARAVRAAAAGLVRRSTEPAPARRRQESIAHPRASAMRAAAVRTPKSCT